MVGRVRHTAVSMQPLISLRRVIARAIANHLYRTVARDCSQVTLMCSSQRSRSAVSQPGSGPGPQSVVRGGSQPSPWDSTASPASGLAGELGARDRLRAVSYRAPELSPRLPTGGAQALKHQRTSLPSPPPRPNGGSSLHGSQSRESSATEIYGHCH